MITLSILIPTKNRSEYLSDILSSILEWQRVDFEIIIQDNSDDTKTKDVVSNHLSDRRVKYFYDQSELSVIDNFENALINSSGKIITAIGDDDGILPIVMNISDWMISNEVDTVLTDKADYVWPDLISKYNSDYNNSKLKFYKCTKVGFVKLDAKNELSKVCEHGGTTMGKLPRVYYGLVARNCLEKVKTITGVFFPGPSPDMANAVSTSLVVENFYYYNFPAFIAGSSSKSTAGLGLKRKHIGNISEIKHLPKNTLSEWDPLIPIFWSGPTIWAQSASVVLKKMNIDKKINYNYLCARTFVFFPQHRNLIFDAFKQRDGKIKNIIYTFYWYLYNWKLRFDNIFPKIMKKIGIKNSSVIVFDNQKSISQAVQTLIHFTSINEIGSKN